MRSVSGLRGEAHGKPPPGGPPRGGGGNQGGPPAAAVVVMPAVCFLFGRRLVGARRWGGSGLDVEPRLPGRALG